jgi:hypothetical protein
MSSSYLTTEKGNSLLVVTAPGKLYRHRPTSNCNALSCTAFIIIIAQCRSGFGEHLKLSLVSEVGTAFSLVSSSGIELLVLS